MTSLPDYDHTNDYTIPAVNLSFCGTVWQFAVLALLCHTHQQAAVFLWNFSQQFAVISIMSIIALYCNKHQIMSINCCVHGLALGWSLFSSLADPPSVNAGHEAMFQLCIVVHAQSEARTVAFSSAQCNLFSTQLESKQ